MTLSSCGGGGGGGERGGGEDGWLEAARGRDAIVDVFFMRALYLFSHVIAWETGCLEEISETLPREWEERCVMNI
jgi:hypothetical protein